MGQCPFTTLSPRQPVTAVPFAVYALNGNWNTNGADIYNDNSGNVGIGTTTPTAKFEVIRSAGDGIGDAVWGQTATTLGAAIPQFSRGDAVGQGFPLGSDVEQIRSAVFG